MKKQKSISILLALCMLFAFLPSTAFAETGEVEGISSFTDEFLASASEHLFEGVEADVFRQVLNDGEHIYQYFRMQSDYDGTATYRVPVQESELGSIR